MLTQLLQAKNSSCNKTLTKEKPILCTFCFFLLGCKARGSLGSFIASHKTKDIIPFYSCTKQR